MDLPHIGGKQTLIWHIEQTNHSDFPEKGNLWKRQKQIGEKGRIWCQKKPENIFPSPPSFSLPLSPISIQFLTPQHHLVSDPPPPLPLSLIAFEDEEEATA